MSERALVVALAVLNLAAGFGAAIPVARLLRRARPTRFAWCYGACIVLYFVECVAFSAGMGTQIFALAAAVVWGVLLAACLPYSTPAARVWRIAASLGAYSSLPTVTFCLLLAIAWFLNRGPMLSAEAGRQFGIPEFVPRPLSTILGFCVALGLGTLALKCGLTVVAALGAGRRKWAGKMRNSSTVME